MKKYFAIAILIILLCLIRIEHDRNPNEEFGYSHDMHIGPTGTFYTFELFRDYKGKRIRGPMISGSMLNLSYNDIDSDGVSELIITTTPVYNTYKTVVKIYPMPIAGRHFSIVSSKGLKVDWPVDGYRYL